MTETNIITLKKGSQEAFVSFLETMVSFGATEIKNGEPVSRPAADDISGKQKKDIARMPFQLWCPRRDSNPRPTA